MLHIDGSACDARGRPSHADFYTFIAIIVSRSNLWVAQFNNVSVILPTISSWQTESTTTYWNFYFTFLLTRPEKLLCFKIPDNQTLLIVFTPCGSSASKPLCTKRCNKDLFLLIYFFLSVCKVKLPSNRLTLSLGCKGKRSHLRSWTSSGTKILLLLDDMRLSYMYVLCKFASRKCK